MTLSLNLAGQEAERLAEKARAAGLDMRTYIERLIHLAASGPPLSEVLAPVREAFHASGMSEDELGDLLEQAKHEMRHERHAQESQ